MATWKTGLLALVAVAALTTVGCSATDSETESGSNVAIAADVFGTSADGESSNETILLSGVFDPEIGDAALRSAGDRFMRVDETGVEHATNAAAEAALARGLYTPNYVADPIQVEDGLELYVDCKGWISEPMRLTFRRILAEELTAAGLTDVTVLAAAG